MTDTILVLGFEGYGGRSLNPAEQVAKALHGTLIGGARVDGRVLPVQFARLAARAADCIDEAAPRVVIGVGLWPGEPVIRLERLAANIADFEIADNQGVMVRAPVVPDAVAAFQTTLPIHAIRDALLEAGIPCRLSGTAGTFLCNAMMYALLRACSRRTPAPTAGFIHVPYLPAQVSALLADLRRERTLEEHQRADLASMSLAVMIEAVRLAAAVALAATSS
jgi:pyroglutamyl-peptidase